MLGGCLYEPKCDGYRAAIFVGPDGAALFSRQGKDLSRYFPELVQAAASQIPSGCVLDGEAVIWAGERLDFDALQRRLVTGVKDLPTLARKRPASFVAFDLLAVAGHDIRETALAGRRELLEHLATDWVPPLNLSPVTRDREQALQWFEEMPAVGVEGLMVKAAGQSYQPGSRQWWKVKRRETVDVVCAAVIGSMSRPEYVVAGLPMKPAKDRWPLQCPCSGGSAGAGRAAPGAYRPASVARGHYGNVAEQI